MRPVPLPESAGYARVTPCDCVELDLSDHPPHRAGLATLLVIAAASEKSGKKESAKPAEKKPEAGQKKPEEKKEEKKEDKEEEKEEKEEEEPDVQCDFVEKMDHNERLGIKKGATEQEIKKA